MARLASVLVPGGSCHLLCFSELRFSDQRPDRFGLNPVAGQDSALAWLATITRL